MQYLAAIAVDMAAPDFEQIKSSIYVP